MTSFSINESIYLPAERGISVVYTVFLACGFQGEEGSQNVFQLNGSIIYSNPWGYLSAETKPLLIIYMVLSLVHSLVVVLWSFRLCKFK